MMIPWSDFRAQTVTVALFLDTQLMISSRIDERSTALVKRCRRHSRSFRLLSYALARLLEVSKKGADGKYELASNLKKGTQKVCI